MLWYIEIIVEEIFTEQKLAFMPFAKKQKSRRWTASLSLRFLARIKNHFNIRFSLQLTCVVAPIISIP
jgi:hypothetical protein